MGIETSSEPQAAKGTEAVEAASLTPESTTEFLAAPPGWQKKLAVKKGGTPKRRDVIFVAPSGEEIKSKAHLERYLKKNPGGPQLADFNWSTGETPRRSERLSTKTKESPTSAEADPPKKRSKKKTPSKDSKDDEDAYITPSEKETTVKDCEGAEGAVAKLFETNEDENAVSKVSEEAEAMKESKENEGVDPNAVEPMEVEARDVKHVEEPEPAREVKEVVSTVEQVQDLEGAEKIVDQMKEPTLVEVTKGDRDTEMVDATPVKHDLEGDIGLKEDLKVTEEVIVDEKEGENGDLKLEQRTEVEAVVEVVAKETSKDVEVTDCKSNTVVDGEQVNINGAFSAGEHQIQEEQPDTVHTQSEHEKPEMNAYFGVTKPKEAHPAEVGVSS